MATEWVAVYSEIDGPKLRALCDHLDCSSFEAVGILFFLWDWGRQNADRSGKILHANREAIERTLYGKGYKSSRNMGRVVDGLLDTGWLDARGEDIYIHDWEQHQAYWYKVLDRRKRDAQRKAESREKQKDSAGDDPGDLPFQESVKVLPVQAQKEQKYTKDFETFWEAYPRRVDKGMAYKKYQARRRDGFSAEELLTAATNYAAVCRRKGKDEEYIKHAKTFLGDTMPFTQFLPKGIEPGGEKPIEDGTNPFAEFQEDSNGQN